MALEQRSYYRTISKSQAIIEIVVYVGLIVFGWYLTIAAMSWGAWSANGEVTSPDLVFWFWPFATGRAFWFWPVALVITIAAVKLCLREARGVWKDYERGQTQAHDTASTSSETQTTDVDRQGP